MMIVCSKHGMQNADYTCPLIHRSIIENLAVKEELFAVRMYVDLLEKNFEFWSDYDFVKSLDMLHERKGSSILMEDLSDEKYGDVFGRIKGVCKKCYAEFLAKNNLLQADEAYKQNPVV